MDASEWVQSFEAAMTARDFAGVRALLADDCRYQANGSAFWTLSNPDEIVQRFKAIADACPDQKGQVTFVVAEGRKAAFEVHVKETHTQPMETPMGTVPPTGLQIDEVVAIFVELNTDGLAVRMGHYYDAAPLTLAVMAKTSGS